MPKILVEKDIMAHMRDGVQRAIEIYRPEGAVPHLC